MSDHDHEEETRDLDVLEKLGYEPKDVDLGTKELAGLTLSFVVFMAFSLLAAWLFLGIFDRVDSFTMKPRPVQPKRPMPENAPVLQTNITAQKDMVELRALEDEKLHAAKPIEGDPGHFIIPVDAAMDILAARGIPDNKNGKIPVAPEWQTSKDGISASNTEKAPWMEPKSKEAGVEGH